MVLFDIVQQYWLVVMLQLQCQRHNTNQNGLPFLEVLNTSLTLSVMYIRRVLRRMFTSRFTCSTPNSKAFLSWLAPCSNNAPVVHNISTVPKLLYSWKGHVIEYPTMCHLESLGKFSNWWHIRFLLNFSGTLNNLLWCPYYPTGWQYTWNLI